jgi:hypothetical protein
MLMAGDRVGSPAQASGPPAGAGNGEFEGVEFAAPYPLPVSDL